MVRSIHYERDKRYAADDQDPDRELMGLRAGIKGGQRRTHAEVGVDLRNTKPVSVARRVELCGWRWLI